MNYETNQEIKKYWQLIGDIPGFLEEFLNLKIVQRLKYISYFCGMDYASKHVYNFKYYVSRYDHSVTVALLTYKFTKSKEATIAALLHDVSTPVFSHAIDYMKKDFLHQEATEQMQDTILKNDIELNRLLTKYNMTLEDINHKNYSIVDNNRPKLCADRVDGILTPCLAWSQTITLDDIKEVIFDLKVYDNEDGEKEIGLQTEATAKMLVEYSNTVNKFTNEDKNVIWMTKLGDIAKRLIETDTIKEENLYTLTEKEVVEIILNSHDELLLEMWKDFSFGKPGELKNRPNIKQRVMYPLVNGNRLTQ